MGLSLILYNLLLPIAVIITLPVIAVWLMLSRRARSGFRQKLGLYYPPELLAQLNAIDRPRRKVVWFHAVSVGEFNAIRPLITDLKDEYAVVLSTTTRTGQNLARRTYPDLPIFYFPYDFRFCVHQALKTIRPDLMVLTETEIWPNFIDITTRRYNIPLILINGRISPNSFSGYQRIQTFITPVLQRITHFYMQSETYAERIIALGAPEERVTVAGNIKFDINPILDPMQKNILTHLFSFTPQDTVLTLASTHSGEDQPLIEVFQTLKKDFPELKLVIAPRHPERVPEIKTLLNARALPFALRSQLSEEHPNETSVVVLDSIGELLTVFGLSSLAVMGGSFVDHGGQNPIEPLSQKIPVIFGPHMFNFQDIVRLILEHHAGFQVETPTDIVNLATELLTQPEIYSNVVENGQRLLEANRGAKMTLREAIESLLNEKEPV